MRKTFALPILVVFLTFSFLCSFSCVSKKKYLSNVATCDSTLQIMNKQNLTLNREIAGLKLQLAEKSGERNALREITDKQDQQITRLEQEIRNLTNQSLNQQQSLDGRIQQKQQELESKKAAIQGFKDAVNTQEKNLNELIGTVSSSLPGYNVEDLSLEVKKGVAYIQLSESLLFRKGTTRLANGAYDILQNIAHVLLQYPQMDVLVLGHTDNQPARNKNLEDNWDLSVLRATPVVRMLTKEFGMNPNQVTAGGKGDSKPKASNDTASGKEQNRRTEIVIYPPTEKILKMILDH